MRKAMVPRISMLIALSILGIGATVYAHCQIPCGIYDDPARFTAMAEHIKTIEKSITQINTSGTSTNQNVRWVMNKEKHADELASIITYYFMAQRIKPGGQVGSATYNKYIKELTLLHQLLQTSMKAKQTADLAQVTTLKTLLHDFSASYLGVHSHAGHTH